ncbi:MAG: CPBP family intramembrane glutamic endopeptidase [Pseudomonadota bacterium]
MGHATFPVMVVVSLYFPVVVFFTTPFLTFIFLVLGICIAGAASRSHDVFAALIMLLCFTSYWEFGGDLFFWPLHLAMPLAMMVVIIVMFDNDLDKVRGLFRLNISSLRASDVALSGVTILLSLAGLMFWLEVTNSDLTDFRLMILFQSTALLLLSAAIFSVINALLEEVVWRGILLRALIKKSNATVAVVVSAASFGIAHFHGVPNGILGVILSGFYAVLLSLLALRTGGIFAPIVTHIFADIAVFIAVLHG